MHTPKGRMEGGNMPRQGTTTIHEEPTATGVVETLKDKAHDVATAATDLATKTKDTVQEWTSSAADAAVHAKDRAVEMASTAAHKVVDVSDDVRALIRRYPFQTLLIGLGAGFLLGQILHRSTSSKS